MIRYSLFFKLHIEKNTPRKYSLTPSENDFHSWQRPSFNLLSQAQLDHIYAAALEVLARVGGEFHDPAVVALLSGCRN